MYDDAHESIEQSPGLSCGWLFGILKNTAAIILSTVIKYDMQRQLDPNFFSFFNQLHGQYFVSILQ